MKTERKCTKCGSKATNWGWLQGRDLMIHTKCTKCGNLDWVKANDEDKRAINEITSTTMGFTPSPV